MTVMARILSRWRRIATIGALSGAIALTGCTAGHSPDDATDEAVSTAPDPGLPAEWVDAVAALERKYDARIGLAVARPGASVDKGAAERAFAAQEKALETGDGDGDDADAAEPKSAAGWGAGVETVGSLQVDEAWSTIKVPIAVAYHRVTGDIDRSVEAALTYSDNDEAGAMWNALGGDAAGQKAVDGVLADGGDPGTRAQRDADGTDIGAFGNTDWSVAGAAAFAANLRCIESGPEVYGVMGDVVDDQRWGLGGVDGAHFKGGWAPDNDTGRYLVRQLGVIPAFGNDTGDPAKGDFVGVAMAARTDDGSYDKAVLILDELAKVITDNPAAGGECPTPAPAGEDG